MDVRAATAADAAEWARMRRALWPDDTDVRAEIAAYLEQTPAQAAVFVVDRGDGRLAGFVEVGERHYAEGCASTPVAFIEGWYVDPDLRRQGLGARLVACAERWARARGHSEIASDSLIDNALGIRAHTALGFSEVERIVCWRKSLT